MRLFAIDRIRANPARLSQHLLHYVTPMNIGKAAFDAVVVKGQAFVVETPKAEQSGVDIVDVHGIYGAPPPLAWKESATNINGSIFVQGFLSWWTPPPIESGNAGATFQFKTWFSLCSPATQ